jgi:hypothetical protein
MCNSPATFHAMMNKIFKQEIEEDLIIVYIYMNDGEAANCKEYYLDTLEDPNTGMPNFPTLVTFLADVRKAF